MKTNAVYAKSLFPNALPSFHTHTLLWNGERTQLVVKPTR
jgi:hypothetical protein